MNDRDFQAMLDIDLPYEGEKDISNAHARRRVLQDIIQQAKRELAATDEWLAVTMPDDEVRTDHGTLVRKPTRSLTGWDQERWRRDAFDASVTYDSAVKRLADPDTGEVVVVPDPTYRKGWDAANRLVTLGGNLAKSGGKKPLYNCGLGYDDEYAHKQEGYKIEEVEDLR